MLLYFKSPEDGFDLKRLWIDLVDLKYANQIKHEFDLLGALYPCTPLVLGQVDSPSG
jgi:hypothetical protein